VKRINEEKALREAKDFIEKELGIEIVINPEEDNGGKKKAAMPLKPAVFVE
jgi:leucyl-tRNA synthetase